MALCKVSGLIILALIAILGLHTCLSQETVGCGGYIKSPVKNFPYNKLSIRLMLPDGTLRYVTDVLPNGAYSIPVYDHGSYVLQADAPVGWTLEPAEGHTIVVEGRDSCREDYNFIFIGFSVVGKVVTKGIDSGPEGIRVSLHRVTGDGTHSTSAKSTEEPFAQATTGPGGKFQMGRVLPGRYKVVLGGEAGPQLMQGEGLVSVTTDNAHLAAPFVIKGYRVTGLMRSDDGKPISGVRFLLYSATVQPGDIDRGSAGCRDSPPAAPTLQELGGKEESELRGMTLLCEVVSDSTGVFEFHLLPGGNYLLVPYYRGGQQQKQQLVFDVQPRQLPIQVAHADVHLGPVFRVAGFSVTGRVVYPETQATPARGVAGAKVFVNGKEAAVTDAAGGYRLDSIKAGQYSLEAMADRLNFHAVHNVKLSPTNPQLPDIVVYKLAICGTVHVDHRLHASSADSHPAVGRTIVVLRKGKDATEQKEVARVITDRGKEVPGSGQFCVLMPPGSYLVRPLVDDKTGADAGLLLAPSEIAVDLVSNPVTGLKFSQFHAVVRGRVRCLEAGCSSSTGANVAGLQVTLKPGGSGSEGGHIISSQIVKPNPENSNEALYEFREVSPGDYSLDLHTGGSSWCWSTLSLPLTVVDHDVDTATNFDHIGYGLTVVTSHQARLDYKLAQGEGATGHWELSRGSTQVCLPQPGEYNLTASSCHRLEETHFVYSTAATAASGGLSPIQIIATEFESRVSFVMEQGEEWSANHSLTVHVELDSGDEPSVRQIDVEWEKAPRHTGEISLWLKPGQTARLTPPTGGRAIATPPSVHVTAHSGDSCAPLVATVQLELGQFITGRFLPAVAKVKVTIVRESTPPDRDQQQQSSAEQPEIDESGEGSAGAWESDGSGRARTADSTMDVVAQVTTDTSGEFHVGPLTKSVRYSVRVAKPGYKFQLETQPAVGGEQQLVFVYKAHKLAEVVVMVVEDAPTEEQRRPLAGALLSIVGDSYRNNELTNEEGKFVFLGLTPGTYYLRAMMKEYDFDSTGTSGIDVTEGRSVALVVKGKRTAYSVFGKVVSLTGEPEVGLLIEARQVDASGQAKPSDKPFKAEQAVTDETGRFRIRGLSPGYRYEVYLKLEPSVSANQLIERAVPPRIPVQMGAEDVEGMKIYAIRRMNMMEVTAIVRTPESYLTHLRLSAFPAANPDHILAQHNFATDSLLFTMHSLPLPQVSAASTGQADQTSNRQYVLRLENNLSPSLYTNISAQEIVFTPGLGSPNGSAAEGEIYQHFVFDFYPVRKTAPDQEVNYSLVSSLALPILLLIAGLLYTQRDTLLPWYFELSNGVRRIVGAAGTSGVSGQVGTGSSLRLGGYVTGGGAESPAFDLHALHDLNNFVAKPRGGPIKKSTPFGRPRKIN